MEGGRDHRREGDGGSYPSASVNSTKDECVEFHGISEGEECVDDLRPTCELEIQVWKPAFLVAGVLCEYSRVERSNYSEVCA